MTAHSFDSPILEYQSTPTSTSILSHSSLSLLKPLPCLPLHPLSPPLSIPSPLPPPPQRAVNVAVRAHWSPAALINHCGRSHGWQVYVSGLYTSDADWRAARGLMQPWGYSNQPKSYQTCDDGAGNKGEGEGPAEWLLEGPWGLGWPSRFGVEGCSQPLWSRDGGSVGTSETPLLLLPNEGVLSHDEGSGRPASIPYHPNAHHHSPSDPTQFVGGWRCPYAPPPPAPLLFPSPPSVLLLKTLTQ